MNTTLLTTQNPAQRDFSSDSPLETWTGGRNDVQPYCSSLLFLPVEVQGLTAAAVGIHSDLMSLWILG